MNYNLILIGLGVVSVLTTSVTEVLKKLFTDKKPTITALIVSTILSVTMSILYIVYNSIDVTPQVICTIVVFIFMAWLVSTLGFDKVKEIINQIKETK